MRRRRRAAAGARTVGRRHEVQRLLGHLVGHRQEAPQGSYPREIKRQRLQWSAGLLPSPVAVQQCAVQLPRSPSLSL